MGTLYQGRTPWIGCPVAISRAPLRMVFRFHPRIFSANRWPPRPNAATTSAMNFRRSAPLRTLAVFFHIDRTSTSHFSVTYPRRNFNKSVPYAPSFWGTYFLPQPLFLAATLIVVVIPPRGAVVHLIAGNAGVANPMPSERDLSRRRRARCRQGQADTGQGVPTKSSPTAVGGLRKSGRETRLGGRKAARLVNAGVCDGIRHGDAGHASTRLQRYNGGLTAGFQRVSTTERFVETARTPLARLWTESTDAGCRRGGPRTIGAAETNGGDQTTNGALR